MITTEAGKKLLITALNIVLMKLGVITGIVLTAILFLGLRFVMWSWGMLNTVRGNARMRHTGEVKYLPVPVARQLSAAQARLRARSIVRGLVL